MIAILKGSKYAVDVTEAVEDLQSSISTLKDHLAVCHMQKLGSVCDEMTSRYHIATQKSASDVA